MIHTSTAGPREPHSRPARRGLGFTLIELVLVIIILGVLAAVAVPKFINLGKSARIASLRTMAAAVNSAAINVRVLCKTQPSCDYNNANQYFYFNDQLAYLNYGWLDAGNRIADGQIDAWVSYSGFTVSIDGGANTNFALVGAPDPANCSVTYQDVFILGPSAVPAITMTSSGC